jgi:hypothetical protein
LAGDHCEVTGLPFECRNEGKNKSPFSPSVDQRIPGQGYTPDNCQLVVHIYNIAKGACTHDDVVRMAKALLEVADARAAANQEGKAA